MPEQLVCQAAEWGLSWKPRNTRVVYLKPSYSYQTPDPGDLLKGRIAIWWVCSESVILNLQPASNNAEANRSRNAPDSTVPLNSEAKQHMKDPTIYSHFLKRVN